MSTLAISALAKWPVPDADASVAPQTNSLDSAVTQMENALSALGDSFAGKIAVSTLIHGKPPASADNADQLPAALQYVSDARTAVDAAANTVYQSTLDDASDQLIASIDSATGSIGFNIEQTLLQAGGDILRDRATISALVTYLLQQ